MTGGFVEIQVRRRARGRPSPRRVLRVVLSDGTRLEIGDQVDRALVWALIEAIDPAGRRRRDAQGGTVC